MFERYNEKARSVIFFARYEASEWGSPYIEPEHVLFGLLREARPLIRTLLSPGQSIEELKHSLEGSLERKEKISTAVDMPLSHPAKRILAYADEEAERLASKHIGPEHILLGILRESESKAAKILSKSGLSVEGLREKIAAGSVALKGDILGELRAQFVPLVLRLTPEIEPAVVFSLAPRADE